MKNKLDVVKQDDSPYILRRRVFITSKHMLIPSGVGICIDCGTESVKSNSDNEASKNNPAQE